MDEEIAREEGDFQEADPVLAVTARGDAGEKDLQTLILQVPLHLSFLAAVSVDHNTRQGLRG